MRFILLLKSDPAIEAGEPPDAEALAAMDAYNQALVRAGVLLAAEGLLPSARGVRVGHVDGKPTRTPGPFAGPDELVAGFWLLAVKSREEAVEWAARCPGRHVVEVREVAELA